MHDELSPFTLREEGKLDEALELAIEKCACDDRTIWDIRALAWCSIFVIERDLKKQHFASIAKIRNLLLQIDYKGARPGNKIDPSLDGDDQTLIDRIQEILDVLDNALENKNFKYIDPHDIDTLRKTDLEKAYKLALEAVANTHGQRAQEALARCLIDLINRDCNNDRYDQLVFYAESLKSIEVGKDKNAILYEEKKNALKKCDPIERIKDKVISFEVHDNYKGAIEYLESIKPRLPEPLHEDYGWAIHKFIQELDFKESAQLIKSYLLKYLKLSNTRPSVLHTCMLNVALRLDTFSSIDICTFMRLWGINNFTDEHYKRKTGYGGIKYQATVEDVFERMCKSIIKTRNLADVQFILDHLDPILEYFPDNIRLRYSKAKFLFLVGKVSEAKVCAINMCKEQSSEFWAWKFLGDCCVNEPEIALSCYAKALLLPAEQELTIDLRIATIKCLLHLHFYAEAKFEVPICP